MELYWILLPRQNWKLLVRKTAVRHYTNAHMEEYIELISLRLGIPYLIIEQIVMQLNTMDRWNLFRSCDNAPLSILNHERMSMTVLFTYYLKRVLRTAVEYMEPLLLAYIGVSHLSTTHLRRGLCIGSYSLVKKGTYVPLALRMTLMVLQALYLHCVWWPIWKWMLVPHLHAATPRCRYCVYGNCSRI